MQKKDKANGGFTKYGNNIDYLGVAVSDSDSLKQDVNIIYDQMFQSNYETFAS